MNLKNKRLTYDYLVLWYSYGSSFSLHSKKYKQNDVIIVDLAQIADSQWNIGQSWIFRQKSSKSHRFFFL